MRIITTYLKIYICTLKCCKIMYKNKSWYILSTVLILIISLYLFNIDSELEFKNSVNYISEYILIGLTISYIAAIYILDEKFIKPKYILFIHSLIILGWIFLSFKDYLVFNGDNFHYIINGRSLFETGQIRDTHALNSPRSSVNPPFLPMLISAVIYFVGESYTAIKILISLLYLSSSLFFYALLLGFTNRKKIALTLSIVAFSSPFLLHASSMIMTEVPFLFASLGSLYAFQKFTTKKETSKTYYILLLLVMITALLTYFSRMIGICIIPTYLLYLFREINFKENIKSIPRSFEGKRFLLFTLLITLTFGGRFAYENYTSDIDKNKEIKSALNIDKIGKTFDSQITIIPFLIDQNLSFRKYASFGYKLDIKEHSDNWKGIYIFILIGICVLIYKNNFIAYYLIFGFIVLMIGSKVSDHLAILRYLSIFLPLYLYVIIIGLEFTIKKLSALLLPQKKQSFQLVNSVVLLSLLIFYSNTALGLGYLVKHEQDKKISEQPYHISQTNFIELSKWCKTNLNDENHYIMSRKPRIFTVYANKPSTRLLSNKKSEPLNSQLIFKKLKDRKVKYVLIDTFSGLAQQVMVPLLNANKDRFRLIKKQGTQTPAYLFEILDQ